MSDPLPRVRVTSARMVATRRTTSPPTFREIDEQTDVGAVYMRTLVRSQLSLALLVVLMVGVCLGSLPLVFGYLPSVAQWRVFGVPVPWVVLGVLVYPFVVLLAYAYVRQAERVERDFVTVLDRVWNAGDRPHGDDRTGDDETTDGTGRGPGRPVGR